MVQNPEKDLINQWEKLPQSQEKKNDFEKSIEFNENWSVTLPWVTLWNPSEALRYVREQENQIISRMRESNEYVISEVKKMLELLFNWWSWKDGDGSYMTPEWRVINHEQFYRGNYVENPIAFLENHEWSLSRFMDKLEEELKEDWIMQRYNPKYISRKTKNKLDELREWKSISELYSMDLEDISFVEIFKEEIQKLSNMPESESEDFYHLKFNYMRYIIRVCENLWYKFGK